MSGNKFLLDTNAVLYILSGDEALAELTYKQRLYISIISEMELLSYRSITAKETQLIKNFISGFTIVNINEDIKELAIQIKKASGLKLPDTIIAATSKHLHIPLISSDKQFKTLSGFSLLFYEK